MASLILFLFFFFKATNLVSGSGAAVWTIWQGGSAGWVNIRALSAGIKTSIYHRDNTLSATDRPVRPGAAGIRCHFLSPLRPLIGDKITIFTPSGSVYRRRSGASGQRALSLLPSPHGCRARNQLCVASKRAAQRRSSGRRPVKKVPYFSYVIFPNC